MIHSILNICTVESLRFFAVVLICLFPSHLRSATFECLDRAGRSYQADPFQNPGSNATVFLFVRVDCPISNRYAPEVIDIVNRFTPLGVRFWLVYPDKETSLTQIRQHRGTYQYPLDAIKDPNHQLVHQCKVGVTPEVGVFQKRRQLVYHGRIDDRYVAFGKYRATAQHHDLENALRSILQGTPPPPSSPGIGCAISPHE